MLKLFKLVQDEGLMSQPTAQEIKESIQDLTNYRDRLIKEVVKIAKKLQMPQGKIESTLAENPEIKKIEKAINQLAKQQQEISNH